MAGDIAKDFALGSNPFTGIPYFGYQAYKNFRDGNYLSGTGNVLWAATSAIPGGGLVGGALRGVGKGLFRVAPRGVARLSRAYKGMGGKAVNQRVGKFKNLAYAPGRAIVKKHPFAAKFGLPAAGIGATMAGGFLEGRQTQQQGPQQQQPQGPGLQQFSNRIGRHSHISGSPGFVEPWRLRNQEGDVY